MNGRSPQMVRDRGPELSDSGSHVRLTDVLAEQIGALGPGHPQALAAFNTLDQWQSTNSDASSAAGTYRQLLAQIRTPTATIGSSLWCRTGSRCSRGALATQRVPSRSSPRCSAKRVDSSATTIPSSHSSRTTPSGGCKLRESRLIKPSHLYTDVWTTTSCLPASVGPGRMGRVSLGTGSRSPPGSDEPGPVRNVSARHARHWLTPGPPARPRPRSLLSGHPGAPVPVKVSKQG